MKQMRWKLLMRILFSELRLRKSEVKLRLMRARLEVLGEDVSLGDVQEAVDEARTDLERVDVALEELVAVEDFDDFPAVLPHEGLVTTAEHVQDLGRLFHNDVLEAGARLECPEDALEETGLVKSPWRN